MSYRNYQIAMGFIGPDLPEGVTVKDFQDDGFMATIYFKNEVPLIAYFYDWDGNEERATKVFDTTLGGGYKYKLDHRRNGHYCVDIIKIKGPA